MPVSRLETDDAARPRGTARAGAGFVLAPNASPMTLDGTRTYVIGGRRAAVIDPGPGDDAHLDAVAGAVADAEAVVILVTHHHPDHAAGAPALAERLGAAVRTGRDGSLRDGDRVETDRGALVAVHTPGHTTDHYAFYWDADRAVFCGDLLMGGQDTALVAPPEGDLGDYLRSLERIGSLEPEILYPAHGPPFDDPARTLDAYARHRDERERQVLDALAGGAATEQELVDAVYGADELDPRLGRAALGAIRAYLRHLADAGAVRRGRGGWRLAEPG